MQPSASKKRKRSKGIEIEKSPAAADRIIRELKRKSLPQHCHFTRCTESSKYTVVIYLKETTILRNLRVK